MIALPSVYAVTDDRVVAQPDFLARARALATGPDIAIVLRARLPGKALLGLADALRHITQSSGARLIVHDRADVARLTDADGVHLPALGLPVDRVAEVLGPGVLVGSSVHDADAARSAADRGASYVFLGNIWETPSHSNRRGLGTAAIVAAQPTRVVAIGGVTSERATLARGAGAVGVAAIRALWDAPDPAAAVRAFRVSCG